MYTCILKTTLVNLKLSISFLTINQKLLLLTDNTLCYIETMHNKTITKLSIFNKIKLRSCKLLRTNWELSGIILRNHLKN